MSWYRRLLTWLHLDDDESAFGGAAVVTDVPGCACIESVQVGDCTITSVRVGDCDIESVRVGDATIESVHCRC